MSLTYQVGYRVRAVSTFLFALFLALSFAAADDRESPSVDADVEYVTPDPSVLAKATRLQGPDFVTRWRPEVASTPIFGNIDPVVRDTIFRKLMMPEISSVTITGGNGVGKTVFANAILNEIYHGRVPEKLRGFTAFVVDVGRLSQGSEHPGVIEKKIAEMVELSRKEKVIWFMDEIHSFRGQGTHESNTNDIFQWLKPYMTSGRIKILGTSTIDEYLAAFGGDPALWDRMHEVKLGSPEGELLLAYLKNWVKVRYDREIDDHVLLRAIAFAEEFSVIDNQPRKTTKLLQEAYSILDLEDSTEPLNIYTLMRAAQSLWNISDVYFDPEEKVKLVRDLPVKLSDSIVGQEEALGDLVKHAKYAIANTQATGRSQFALTFVGAPGVGKTETVFSFGRAMDLPVHRVMMSHYATARPGDIEDLKADIMQALQKNPFSILFFDEIEKCPVPVQDALLEMLDSGQFTVRVNMDPSGRNRRTHTVDVRNAFVIFGTNAGFGYLNSLARGDGSIGFAANFSQQKVNYEALVQNMKGDNLSGPLVDRTEIIPFNSLSQDEFARVLLLHARKTLQSIADKKDIEFVINRSALDNLMVHLGGLYYRPNMSSRRLNAILDQSIREPVTNALLENLDASRVQVSYQLNKGDNGTPAVEVTVLERRSCVELLSK